MNISLVAILFLIVCPFSRANTLYSETFEVAPVYVAANGSDKNNISSVSYGKKGAGFPNLAAGEYGGTSQYFSEVESPGSIDGGALVIGSHIPVYEKSRSRSYVTFIDTSSAVAGQYEVSFEVSDFQSADENTRLLFHLFEGTEAVNGHVDMQVTFQKMLPELAPTIPGIKTGKGATAGRVAVENPITGNGSFKLSFGISEAGKPGDWLALVWTQFKGKGMARMPSMTIDNVAVAMLPVPPDVTASESLPDGPLGQSGDWKLLPGVSDEFDSAWINPAKWNNNPGSWGAWSWEPENTYLESGKLGIKMVHEPHLRNQTRLFYKSGILRSHRQMTYGYYEARIKGCDLFPGACPAFWVYSDGKKYSGKVRYCEIDFVELQMNELNHDTNVRDSVHHIDMNLHLRLADENGKVTWHRPGTDPDLCKNAWVAPWDPREDFHVYGCDVTPETITWYIDGEEVAKKENLYWHEPMNITLSLGLRHPHIGWKGQEIKPVPGAATAEGFPTSMEVDYVRVWERE
ncbi:MAG: kappa-carrageenase [Verrucomicrobiales bacterium]|nr:kappa-carrageenase [Verrucomicrobiales bacterium]